MVKVYTVSYDGKDYLVADIPDVITDTKSRILIGSHALNASLYDDEKGYQDSTAEEIDEQIYAYMDDQYFLLDDNVFLSKVKELLD
jgi:hypothetical protein